MLRRTLLVNGVSALFSLTPKNSATTQTVFLAQRNLSDKANNAYKKFIPAHSSMTSRFFSATVLNNAIDISGIDKAALLMALYNKAEPTGFGFLNPKAEQEMSYEQAQKFISAGLLDFDYLNGRVMKINLAGNTLFTGLYDRDNGKGMAAFAVSIASKNNKTYKPT